MEGGLQNAGIVVQGGRGVLALRPHARPHARPRTLEAWFSHKNQENQIIPWKNVVVTIFKFTGRGGLGLECAPSQGGHSQMRARACMGGGGSK